MNARNFAPIQVGKVAPAPTHIPAPRPQYLDAVRAVPDFEAMDETASWAQTYRPAKPADADDVFSQDEDTEDYEDARQVRELLAQRPTPNGKWVGIATDALAQVRELQRVIRALDFFSANTGLLEAQRAADDADELLVRAGVRGVL